ncbi:MAG TPA: CYTH and CHAD domain-containing protein [Terriglobales bacterium]|nr:CYTH and CHAD domain-containing protein [Terriglobales bacterium]
MRAASPDRQVTLGASPTFHLPDFSGIADGVVASPEHEARLETTYYDTVDLRLARWGVSLSHHDRRWTLRIPMGGGGESELDFEGSTRRPPVEALDLVRVYLRGASLEPVARLSNWRRRVALRDGSGHELAEVVDDEVSVLSGRRVAARFREVEVDLEAGGDELLGSLLERLQQAGAVRTPRTPLYLRALGPTAQGEPDVAVPRLPREPAAADVVRAAIAAAVQLVLRYDPLVRLGGDPENVHQARVGTRRLRSHLRTFRPLLDRAWADGLRDELGWLAGELGPVRDREVLHERLLVLVGSLPAVDVRPAAALAATLAGHMEAARTELLQAMSTPRYFELIDRLVEAAARPALLPEASEPAARVLPALVVKPWRDLRRAAQALDERSPDADLHRVRILAKRVRYASEAAGPAVGAEATRFGKLAAGLQDVLGQHQDSVTMQDWLRSVATARRRAFVAGELCAIEARRAADSRANWPAAWHQLDRRRARAWMRP